MTSLARRIAPSRVRASLLATILAACGGTSPDVGRDASAPDADGDAGAAVQPDGALDAVGLAPVLDAGAPDTYAGCCWYPSKPADPDPARYCLNSSLCTSAVRLDPGMSIRMQDTTTGGRGDCATYSSGWGGRNLYYSVTVPAGKSALVAVEPITPTELAVFRVLSDCDITRAEDGARGFSVGHAERCLFNEGTTDRTVVIAVGRYSGEEYDLTLVFDLSVQLFDFPNYCGP